MKILYIEVKDIQVFFSENFIYFIIEYCDIFMYFLIFISLKYNFNISYKRKLDEKQFIIEYYKNEQIQLKVYLEEMMEKSYKNRENIAKNFSKIVNIMNNNRYKTKIYLKYHKWTMDRLKIRANRLGIPCINLGCKDSIIFIIGKVEQMYEISDIFKLVCDSNNKDNKDNEELIQFFESWESDNAMMIINGN
jgi:hypothetical protein